MARRAAVLVVLVLAVAAPLPGQAASRKTYAPPFPSSQSLYDCNDDDGTATCTLTSSPVRRTGRATSAAKIGTLALPGASGGHATSWAMNRVAHRLRSPASSVTITATVHVLKAESVGPPLVPPHARSFIYGSVAHDRCGPCGTSRYTILTDSWLEAPRVMEDEVVKVTLSVRRLDGEVPAGTLTVSIGTATAAWANGGTGEASANASITIRTVVVDVR